MKPLFTRINRQAWILMALFFALGVMTTSCSDDEDDNATPNEQNDSNNDNNNEAEEGSYNVSIEGEVSAEMSGGQALFSREAFQHDDKFDSTEDAALIVGLTDTTGQNPRQVTISVYKPNADRVDAGTYDLLLQNETELQTGSAVYFQTGSGESYTLPPHESDIKGNVELTSVTQTDVEGQLNNVFLRKVGFDTTATVTLNGAFHAKKVN